MDSQGRARPSYGYETGHYRLWTVGNANSNPIYWKTDDDPLEWTGRLAVSTHGATTYLPETFHDLRTLHKLLRLIRLAGILAVLLDGFGKVEMGGVQGGKVE
jgi:hypothetical protein